mmetsp:Transcript_20129/g.50810  ORF Transcript_20129/g.50810 Transcript_20129/m.50810 type:complete len:330 (-) Transcript_20129:2429-3418(-)
MLLPGAGEKAGGALELRLQPAGLAEVVVGAHNVHHVEVLAVAHAKRGGPVRRGRARNAATADAVHRPGVRPQQRRRNPAADPVPLLVPEAKLHRRRPKHQLRIRLHRTIQAAVLGLLLDVAPQVVCGCVSGSRGGLQRDHLQKPLRQPALDRRVVHAQNSVAEVGADCGLHPDLPEIGGKAHVLPVVTAVHHRPLRARLPRLGGNAHRPPGELRDGRVARGVNAGQIARRTGARVLLVLQILAVRPEAVRAARRVRRVPRVVAARVSLQAGVHVLAHWSAQPEADAVGFVRVVVVHGVRLARALALVRACLWVGVDAAVPTAVHRLRAH